MCKYKVLVFTFWTALVFPSISFADEGSYMKGGTVKPISDNVVATDNITTDQKLQASAVIQSTSDANVTYGTITFTQEKDGVTITGAFENVPNPGKHGFHVHENGSCEDVGKAAGGHFNPDQVKHGTIAEGHEGAHAGDMENVEIGEDGKGSVQLFLADRTLTEGKYDLVGKSVILHEKADDFSQPTGNAGGRIGCGIIVQATEK